MEQANHRSRPGRFDVNSTTVAAQRRQYLGFTVAGGDYAVPILMVKEILPYEGVTRIPSTSRSLRGVTNVRGSVLPVVDLAWKIQFDETIVTKRTCVLVVEVELNGGSLGVGVMADAVSEVIELATGDIDEPPPLGGDVVAPYVIGLGKVGRRLVLLLDLEAVLSADERDLARAAAAEAVVSQAELPGHGTRSMGFSM
jgi:chemotaxis signal transduction protein